MICAKKTGIQQRIIHSHNSGNMEGFVRRMFHEINKIRIYKFATDYWACSEKASQWFYRKTYREQVIIIPNAIDTRKMKYDLIKRDNLRKQYGWDRCFIVGNVGRFHFQKNQRFLLEAFQMFHEKVNHSILVLVGQGEDRDMLEKRAGELGLKPGKDIFFVGVQNDIQAWLSCFDLFVFPSLFEGLSITMLEAQANGLPVLAAQEIFQKAVAINENISFLSLSAGALQWGDRMLQMSRNLQREHMETVSQRFIERGYDITHEAKKMEKFFLNGDRNGTDC